MVSLFELFSAFQNTTRSREVIYTAQNLSSAPSLTPVWRKSDSFQSAERSENLEKKSLSPSPFEFLGSEKTETVVGQGALESLDTQNVSIVSEEDFLSSPFELLSMQGKTTAALSILTLPSPGQQESAEDSAFFHGESSQETVQASKGLSNNRSPFEDAFVEIRPEEKTLLHLLIMGGNPQDPTKESFFSGKTGILRGSLFESDVQEDREDPPFDSYSIQTPTNLETYTTRGEKVVQALPLSEVLPSFNFRAFLEKNILTLIQNTQAGTIADLTSEIQTLKHQASDLDGGGLETPQAMQTDFLLHDRVTEESSSSAELAQILLKKMRSDPAVGDDSAFHHFFSSQTSPFQSFSEISPQAIRPFDDFFSVTLENAGLMKGDLLPCLILNAALIPGWPAPVPLASSPLNEKKIQSMMRQFLEEKTFNEEEFAEYLANFSASQELLRKITVLLGKVVSGGANQVAVLAGWLEMITSGIIMIFETLQKEDEDFQKEQRKKKEDSEEEQEESEHFEKIIHSQSMKG